MIVLDTSALFAVFLEEEEARFFSDIMQRSSVCLSLATLLECQIVAMRGYPFLADGKIDLFLSAIGATLVAVERPQTDIAIDAYRRFGKGSGHPAQLNFGDCFSYALAKERNLPLLFKGADFAKTDVLIYTAS